MGHYDEFRMPEKWEAHKEKLTFNNLELIRTMQEEITALRKEIQYLKQAAKGDAPWN